MTTQIQAGQRFKLLSGDAGHIATVLSVSDGTVRYTVEPHGTTVPIGQFIGSEDRFLNPELALPLTEAQTLLERTRAARDALLAAMTEPQLWAVADVLYETPSQEERMLRSWVCQELERRHPEVTETMNRFYDVDSAAFSLSRTVPQLLREAFTKHGLL